MKALVGAFNQEKALVGAYSVIVQLHRLIDLRHYLGMMERPYYIDFGTFRLVIHKLVTSKYFDLGISAVIGLNVITMAMEFYMMPDVSQDQSNNCLLSL